MENVNVAEYKITDLGLSLRATNALTKNHIMTVGDLLSLTEERLRSLRGLGSKSLAEISDVIDRISSDDFTFKPDYYDLHEWMSRNLKERSVRAVVLNIGLYGGAPVKATDIADRFGITRSRMGQILDRAYAKIKGGINSRQIDPAILSALLNFAAKGVRARDVQGLSDVYDSQAIARLYCKLVDQAILYEDPNLSSEWVILPDMVEKYQDYTSTALEWLKRQPGFVDINALSEQSRVPIKILSDLSSVKIEGDTIALVNGYRKNGIDNAALIREVMLENVKPMTMDEISQRTGIEVKILRGLIYRIPTVVNIGRSTFGLTDFGYSSKDTEELICDYLQSCNEPVQIDDVIKHVLHYRIVDPKSVNAAIYDSSRLSRLDGGFIALAAWGYAPAASPSKAQYTVLAQDAVLSVLRDATRALSIRETSEAITVKYGDTASSVYVTISATLKKLIAAGQVEQLGTTGTFYYQLKTPPVSL